MTTKIATTNIQDTALTTLLGPKVTTIVYPGTETATDTAGGETINLTGNGFQSGCSVLVASTSASVVTFISTTQISFTAPAQSAGTYVIYVINPDGGTAISIPGISYSGTPNWTTTAGSLGTAYEAGSISATLTATGDAPITYTLASGTLPTGSSLSSGGSLSGTAPATASATTYNFTITAKDAQNQTTNRAFSLTINPDVVSWSTPASLATYNVFTNTAIANVTMSATSAAGGSITYTADTLPTGLSITGANIAGTPTVAASTTTVLTATATSTRTATRTINWVVTVANDTYWKNVTLLLNGETSVTPFISDASTNNLGLIINGDTKSTLFNPYQGDGYYSNYFNGSSDYFSITANSAFNLTGSFTAEAWIYFTAAPATNGSSVTTAAITSYGSASQSSIGFEFDVTIGSSAGVAFMKAGSGIGIVANYTFALNTWYHIAVTYNGTTGAIYINGVAQTLTTNNWVWTSPTSPTCYIGRGVGYTNYFDYFPGYISNLRIVNGAVVYTSNFTPISSPLTAITNTALLICQSNRFVDKSSNALALTLGGSPQISPAIPFTASSSYSTYGSTYFDGTGDYLTTTGSSIGSSNYTVEAWIYPTSLTTISIFSLGTSDSTGNMVFYVSSDGSINLYADNASRLLSSASIIKINQWQHVVLVRNGTTSTIYVNGVSAASSTNTYTSTSTAYQICAGYGGLNTPITGYISNLRVVNGTAVYTSAFTPPTSPLTAITNTSLLTLQYNGGANNYGIIDNSNFNNIITRAGNATQGTFSPYSVTGWSNYFNGSTDYISLPGSFIGINSGTADCTYELWILAPVTAGSGNTQTVLAGSTSGADPTGCLWMYIGNGGQLVVYTPSVTTYLITDTTLPAGTWNHIAVTRSSNSWKLWLNGVQQGTAVTDATSIAYSVSKPFTIGRMSLYTSSTYYFRGYISNLRILNGTALYTSAFTPLTIPLTPITNTGLLTCQSNRFVDNSPINGALTVTGTPSVQAYSPFGSISEATPTSYSNYFTASNSDYFSISNNSAFDFGTGDCTFESWVYITSLSTWQQIVFAQTFAGNGANGYQFFINTSGYLVMESQSSSTDQAITATNNAVPLNTWTHVAFTRASGTNKLFVNGNVCTTSGTLSQAISTGGYDIYVGVYHYGATIYYYSGYISNLRLVKGTAVYTTTFTPSTTPLTAISGTSLLTCQSTRMIDNSTNNFAITSSGSPKVYKYNPFGYTAQSNISYTPTTHGGSIYLDGTGDYLSIPYNSIFNFGTSNFTIELWVYFNSVSSAASLYIPYSSPYGQIAICTTSGTPNTLYCFLGTASNTWDIPAGGAGLTIGTVKTGNWYHVAVVRNGSTFTTYFNGVATATATSASALYSLSSNISIGYDPSISGAYLNGYISDLRVVKGTAVYTSNFVPPSQTLTNYSTTYPSSLLLNFTNGGIIDQHSSNVLETAGNTQVSTAVKKYGSASIYQDGGSGSYIKTILTSTLAIPASTDFTIEGWFYFTAWVSVNCIYQTGSANEYLAVRSSGTTIEWHTTTGQSNYAVSLSLNTWYHIAATRSGSTVKMFLNGTSLTGTGGTPVSTEAIFSVSPLYLLQYFNNSNGLNGYADDLRITKGYARYIANFTAPTSALITK